MANAASVAETVRALVAPTAASLGLELWDVEFLKEGARNVLRVTIDKDDGVTIDDCEKMHRAIDPLLDEADPIDSAYDLEVSSPGVERELRTDAHIAAFTGAEVEVRLFSPRDGQKVFTGTLAGKDAEGNLLLEQNGTELSFAPRTVSKIKTVFHF